MKAGLLDIFRFVAALFVSVIFITIVELATTLMFPMPPGMDMRDHDKFAAYVDQLPLAAFLGLELAYASGSFAGGLLIGKMGGGRRRLLALLLGVLLTAAGISNLLAIPHPMWVGVMTTVTFMPMVWLGLRVGCGPVE